jgi:hypothetical protein
VGLPAWSGGVSVGSPDGLLTAWNQLEHIRFKHHDSLSAPLDIGSRIQPNGACDQEARDGSRTTDWSKLHICQPSQTAHRLLIQPQPQSHSRHLIEGTAQRCAEIKSLPLSFLRSELLTTALVDLKYTMATETTTFKLHTALRIHGREKLQLDQIAPL